MVKYVTLLLVAILISSCSSSKPIVSVEMRNMTRADWILVSVRDTSVVLLAPFEEIGKSIAFTHCVVIPTKEISRIILHSKGSFLSSIPMALFGAGVGYALKACDCDQTLYHIVIGMVIGLNIPKLVLLFQSFKQDAYFLWLESDRARLRKESVFPVEPEIMEYVK